MKLSIFLLSLGVVAGDKTMLKEGSLRNMQEEVPFELHEGKCMLAEDAWDMLPPEQRANQQGFENFNAFCGYGGSCFGDAEGCCRFANGLLIECDVDREFYHALCVCNQHTAPQDRETIPPNAPVQVAIPPTVSPSPTQSPTPLSENCGRYDPDSPLYMMPHPFAGIPGYATCSANSDCSSSCCMKAYCLCKTGTFEADSGCV